MRRLYCFRQAIGYPLEIKGGLESRASPASHSMPTANRNAREGHGTMAQPDHGTRNGRTPEEHVHRQEILRDQYLPAGVHRVCEGLSVNPARTEQRPRFSSSSAAVPPDSKRSFQRLMVAVEQKSIAAIGDRGCPSDNNKMMCALSRTCEWWSSFPPESR
jgi:hypothetical protein